MAVNIVLRKGKIVFPDGVREGDLVIEHGEIAEISPDFQGTADREIDCKGKYIFSGVIDAHVHMRTPGALHKEDFTTGSMAAASGGVTTFLDMPNNNPAIIDKKALLGKRVLAEENSMVNFGFFFGATEENLEEVLSAKNIAGVKVFMGTSTGGLLVKSDTVLDGLLERVKVPLVFHAEDEGCIEKNRAVASDMSLPEVHSIIRPAKCAELAVKRLLHLWKKYENTSQIHLAHVTSKKEIDVLRKFKSPNVSAEVTPHHLFLNTDAYGKLGSLVKVNPPLRSSDDQKALWDAINEGLIEVVASDHAPHLKNEKEVSDYDSVPAGVPGVETLFPLMLNAVYENRLSFEKVAQLTSENPARIFHVARKGKIQIGYDADLVIVDMELEKVVAVESLQTKCAWSPFEGMSLHGWPVVTIIGGVVLYENGKFVSGKRGREVSYVS